MTGIMQKKRAASRVLNTRLLRRFCLNILGSNLVLATPVFAANTFNSVYISEFLEDYFFSSRRRHTISVSAFLLNRSSDLSVLRAANCDGHTVTIRPRILQAI